MSLYTQYLLNVRVEGNSLGPEKPRSYPCVSLSESRANEPHSCFAFLPLDERAQQHQWFSKIFSENFFLDETLMDAKYIQLIYFDFSLTELWTPAPLPPLLLPHPLKVWVSLDQTLWPSVTPASKIARYPSLYIEVTYHTHISLVDEPCLIICNMQHMLS